MAVLALIGIALVVRALALPTDGLVYDDAWVVAGASKGSVGDLPTISTNHPGFSLLLMGWARGVSTNSSLFAIGPFLVGALLPAAAYWVLRRGGMGRAVSCGAAALLLSAPYHVLYSGRIKPYVIESLVGVVMVGLLPRIVARKWRWPTAAAWLAAALLLGTLSGLTLILTAIAVLVLAAHPAGDRAVRLTVLGVQGIVQALYLWWVQSNFDAGRLAQDWETTYDSYIETDAGLWSVVRQVGAHTARLGQGLVSSGKFFGLVLALVAVAGIAHMAIRSEQRVAARFLAACWGVALMGGFVRQVPYGPEVVNPFFPGGRASLWLLPGLVFGVAWAVNAAIGTLARRDRMLVRPLAMVAATAGVGLAVIGLPEGQLYPPFGTRSAIETIKGFDDPSSVTIVANGTTTVAAEPGIEVTLTADRSDLTGFRRGLTDPGYVTLPQGVDIETGVNRLVEGFDQVIVFDGFTGFGDQTLPDIEAALEKLGYRPGAEWVRGATAFQIWAADSSNGA